MLIVRRILLVIWGLAAVLMSIGGAVLSTAALTGILCLCCRTILWVQSVSLLARGSMEPCELLSAYFFMFMLMIWAMLIRVLIRFWFRLKFVSL